MLTIRPRLELPGPSRVGRETPLGPAVALSLPSGAPASIEIPDMTKRRVAVLGVGGLGLGPHRVTMADKPLLPEVYLVRLAQGAGVLIANALIVR